MSSAFGKLLLFVLAGVLSILFTGLIKVGSRAVVKSIDGIISTKVARDLTEPALQTNQNFELRLNPKPENSTLNSVVARAVVKAHRRSVSADSPDAFGYCDFAIGNFPMAKNPIDEAAKIIKEDWLWACNGWDQSRWAYLFETGLISEQAALHLADQVWPD